MFEAMRKNLHNGSLGSNNFILSAQQATPEENQQKKPRKNHIVFSII
ncbi:MAG: hypothetical protein CDV28_10145 [Candidatus Electronema aureum]|uniref:Uncharacterized protein n=1 Tax=Candidatus Electronema aureum TaxID=2005002 RepID=A0A521G557_9BACT|nr:MAG: hypothetical protein CDV28_10145 [Candidatus Electronema aureum]